MRARQSCGDRTWLHGAAWLLLAACASARAAGDAQIGQQLYESRCIACHSEDAHRVGPAHRGVFGRQAGKAPGYDYSPALSGATLVWDAQTLDHWLANPERLLPGQRMGYSVPDAADRSHLIAYLRSLGPR